MIAAGLRLALVSTISKHHRDCDVASNFEWKGKERGYRVDGRFYD